MKKYLIINSLVGVGVFTAGYLISKKVNKPKIDEAGILYIENIPGEPEDLFLSLLKPVEEVKDNDYVTLKVSSSN